MSQDYLARRPKMLFEQKQLRDLQGIGNPYLQGQCGQEQPGGEFIGFSFGCVSNYPMDALKNCTTAVRSYGPKSHVNGIQEMNLAFKGGYAASKNARVMQKVTFSEPIAGNFYFLVSSGPYPIQLFLDSFVCQVPC